MKNWSYRDDVGSHWGIKGYEEQVTEVGSHHGHLAWPQNRFLGTFDSGRYLFLFFKVYILSINKIKFFFSVRRGFQVFAKNCANCHGAIYKKYDVLLDKAYKQLELAVKNCFSLKIKIKKKNIIIFYVFSPLSRCSPLIQATIISNNTTTKNGLIEIESFTIESTRLITVKMVIILFIDKIIIIIIILKYQISLKKRGQKC